MPTYDVRIFLAHCFVPSLVQVGSTVAIEPFAGGGGLDAAELVARYVQQVLGDTVDPAALARAAADQVAQEGASVVVTVRDVEAGDHIAAIKQTEETVLLARDVLALRQLQRGVIVAFLTAHDDGERWHYHAHFRRPYALFRRVMNLPVGETEGDIIAPLVEKARRHPLLRVYLALYADTVVYTDTLVTDVGIETRLLKTWGLLETMAIDERPVRKKDKVRALYARYQTSTHPDYRGHAGKDLLDIAYEWRNIVAHAGGCAAARTPAEQQFCRDYASDLEEVLEDLNQDCRWLLHAFAHSLP